MTSLRELSVGNIDFAKMDPVAKMMLITLVSETKKIQDYVDSIGGRLVERFCTDFIPREKVEAMPAVTMLNPTLKKGYDDAICHVGADAAFAYKTPLRKDALNYIPIFNTALLPHKSLVLVTPNKLWMEEGNIRIKLPRTNQMWLGIRTSTEIDCLKGLSLYVKGTNGIMPTQIYSGIDDKELDFATMLEMENIEMAEPFDAQQTSGQFFSFVESWKECLLNIRDAGLLYITDETVERDLFKPRQCPASFRQWLDERTIGQLDPATVWLRLDFPEDYEVPDSCQILLNTVPVTNIDVCSLTLTQAQPIAKLQNQEGSYFLRILETSNDALQQGFNTTDNEVVVRDFDAACYNNGDLYRDVRNLYNHFVDDYYAFIEYNGIKDGEVLKVLRETINKLGKSVGIQNSLYKFDSGTFVMKNMNQSSPSITTKVSYITTNGKLGNAPQRGEAMENRKLPTLEQKVSVLISATGGTNKATADERYEQLRYYALTGDRLYTRMDVDAFLRREVLAEFGKEEFKRIFIKTSIEGTGGETRLQRGLYIDIEFKDRKNYEQACAISFDSLMQQRIINKSCIAMPIIVKLTNLDV
ncbi:MAG: hypothetical protein IKQ62_03775 [Bacteroidaceae bacterium]|nr:hypothetical protein [Bacteroidaceae bacterium]